jgi:hypothetical protein
MTAFWRAWSIWAVCVGVTATALGYTAARPLPAKLASEAGSGLDGAVGIVFIAAFATVGALLAWKQPRNPIGWLLSGTGLAYAVAAFGVFLAHFPRTLTLSNWLGFLYLLGIGLCVFVVLLFPTGRLPSRRWRPVAWAAGAGLAGWVLGCVALVPVAIGVAVLRYRLYDIDRIISRTVAYAIVTGLLIGIYAGLVLLATQVLLIHSAVAVAAATLIAAGLFNPVRRRVQHRVDRRFNRARYDAETTVAAFAARLKDAVDLDAVRADLASVVRTALEPAQVWVWTGERQPDEAARTAARIASSSPSNGSLPSMRSPLT